MKFCINIFMFSIISLLFISGCGITPSYQVSVDSICGVPINENRKIAILIPGAKEINPEDLQFIEYSNYIKRALAKKGYVFEENIGKADIAIFLTYGIGNPEEHMYTYSAPIIGQTGVSSSSTYGLGNYQGSSNSFGNTTNFSGRGSYYSQTKYTPQYGVIGATTEVGSYTTYTRFIFISAFDLKTEDKKQIWKTSIISTGSSGDLRRVFPILVGAAARYLGDNTGKMINVTLEEDSKEVLEIKGISQDKTASK